MKTRSLVIFLLLAGVALRLYDLTDLPLDFHPTRQLFSLIKARGIYYSTLSNVPEAQRQTAIDLWKSKTTFEPEIMENLVVFIYKFTGEKPWVARIYSSLFWAIGGIFLFLLTRELTSERGALLSLTFYLFLPYAAIASRSFQPDPLMTMLTIIFWWCVYRWGKDPSSWKFAMLAGVFGGFAILVKFVAAFFVIGAGFGGLLLSLSPERRSNVGAEGPSPYIRLSFRERPQLFIMIFLGLLPGLSWVIYGTYVSDFLLKKFEGRFIPSLLISPVFYLDWFSMINEAVGLTFVALGLLGLYLYRHRIFPLSLWVAYLVYAIAFDYHISTHNYYSLLLIPIVAISLAPLAEYRYHTRGGLSIIDYRTLLIIFLVVSSFLYIRTLHAVDYRPQAQLWAEINSRLQRRAKLTALTEDYGMRLEYWGWRKAAAWPLSGDLIYHEDIKGAKKEFEKRFATLTANRDYFIVTMFAELDRQPELKAKLSTYAIFAQGDGYIVYDIKP